MNWKELILEATVIICTTVLAGMALHVFKCKGAVCMISIVLIFFAIIISVRFILEVIKDRKMMRNLIDSKDEVIKNLKEQLNNNESLKELQEFIKSFVEFGSLCFGVLLTFFGVVIQSSSETIRRMKRRSKPFNRFIEYNRNMIIFSLALTVYAYILGNLNFWKISISEFVISIFIGAFVYFLYGLLYLLLIFFNLLHQHEN